MDFQYSPFIAMHRRRSKFHGVTFLAVVVILILQVVLLVGLIAFWRADAAPAGGDEEVSPAPVRVAPVKVNEPIVERVEEPVLLVPSPAPIERVRPEWLTGRETPETSPADRFVVPEE
jgi:hypothetical protein